ncbi:MAG: fibronectin type III domain-containing protein, partial [Candidatus Micrarchaeota archaeon]
PSPSLTPSPSISPSPSAIPSSTFGPASAPAISLVQAVSITQTSAAITWITDVDSDSLVKYGKTIPSLTKSDPALVQSHAISLSGLSPNTVYQYNVKSCAQGSCGNSVNYQFKTLRKMRRASLGPTGYAVLAVINELEPQIDEIKQSGEDTWEIEQMVQTSIDLVERDEEAQADAVIQDAKRKTQDLVSKVRGRLRASSIDAIYWLMGIIVVLGIAYFAYASTRGKKRRK